MSDVFISYAREDAAIASRLRDMLAAETVRVFFDVGGLVAGESYSDQIANALAKADAVVVLLSRHSKRSRWVEQELARALETGKTVIPVLLDPDAKENWVWPLVADRQAVTVRTPSDLDRVVQFVKQSMEPQVAPRANHPLSRWLTLIIAVLAALFGALVTFLVR